MDELKLSADYLSEFPKARQTTKRLARQPAPHGGADRLSITRNGHNTSVHVLSKAELSRSELDLSAHAALAAVTGGCRLCRLRWRRSIGHSAWRSR
jgi:hypothetical protein